MPADINRPSVTLDLRQLDSMLCADRDVVSENYSETHGGNRLLVRANYGALQGAVDSAIKQGLTHVTLKFEKR